MSTVSPPAAAGPPDPAKDLIPLNKAAAYFPKNSNGTSKAYPTLNRWANHGACGGAVKLGTVRVGSFVYTTKEMIQQFIDECGAHGGAN